MDAIIFTLKEYLFTNHSECTLKSKIMRNLMIIFVVAFSFWFLKNILKCNCSLYSTWKTMYLPNAILCNNVLKAFIHA